MSFLADIQISQVVLCSGLGLVLIGLWGMLTQRHIIRMIIGFSLLETGINIVMVSIPLPLSTMTCPWPRQSAASSIRCPPRWC